MLTMGNRLTKYKHNISVLRNKDIVSKYTLQAIEQVIDYLKLNAWNRQMFQMPGTQRRIKRVAGYIHSGGGRDMRQFFTRISLAEVARGLLYFLVRLPKPLLPLYIQTLALDAPDNIPPELVASDILGLIVQDISGVHFTLITLLLEFLLYLRKYNVHSELTESATHITMLPVFFNLQSQHLPEWRNIASIFMEMVGLTPTLLLHEPSVDNSLADNVIIERWPDAAHENNHQDDMQHEVDINEMNIMIQDLNENVVFHQYRIRRGNEGDANPGEIIPISLLRRGETRALINQVFGYRRR